MAVTVVTSGVLTDKLTGSVSGSITLAAGDSLVAIAFFDASLASWDATPAWGSTSLDNISDKPANGSDLSAFTLHNASAGTQDLTASIDTPGAAFDLIYFVLRGLAATPNDRVMPASSAGSTTPSSGATAALSQALEFAIGVAGTEGPSSDNAGSWSNGFTTGPRGGTTGGVATSNRTLSAGYINVNSTSALTAAKTGITSRAWTAACYTFKCAAAAALTSGAPAGASGTAPGATATPGGVTIDSGTPTAASSAAPGGTASAGGVTIASGAPNAAAATAPPAVASSSATLTSGAPQGASAGAPDAELAVADFYPSIAAGSPGQAEQDPYNLQPLSLPDIAYRSTTRGLRAKGKPYFSLSQNGVSEGVGGSEFTLVFSADLTEAPTKLASDDERHYLMSWHEHVVGGRELFSLFVTPSGRVGFVGGSGTPLVTPIGIWKFGTGVHVVSVQTFGTGAILYFDSMPIVQGTCGAQTTLAPSSEFGTPTRLMVFSDPTGITRITGVLHLIQLATENQALQWPVDEGKGDTVRDQEALGDPDGPPWTDRYPALELTDYPGEDWRLVAQWYDPAELGLPRPWSSNPGDIHDAFEWDRRVAYVNRDPAPSSFTPVASR